LGQSVFSDEAKPSKGPGARLASATLSPSGKPTLTNSAVHANRIGVGLWAAQSGAEAGTVFSPIGYAKAAEIAQRLDKKGPVEPAPLKVLCDFLALDGQADRMPQLQLATAFWSSVNPRIVDKAQAARLEKLLGVMARPLDLSNRGVAAGEVDSWVLQNTRDEVSQPGRLAGLPTTLVTDGVIFRAAWADRFDPAQTKPAPFTNADGTTVELPFMHRLANLPYLKNADVELTAVPFTAAVDDDSEPHYKLVVMMPLAGGDLTKLRATLSAERLQQWMKEATASKEALAAWEAASPESDNEAVRERWVATYPVKAVTLALPRFVVRSPRAAMKGSDESGQVTFAQGCSLSINEAGAGHATSEGAMYDVGAIGQPVNFTANRPFLFTVVDEVTGTIILAGSYTGATNP
jgi:hypothetical protein